MSPEISEEVSSITLWKLSWRWFLFLLFLELAIIEIKHGLWSGPVLQVSSLYCFALWHSLAPSLSPPSSGVWLTSFRCLQQLSSSKWRASKPCQTVSFSATSEYGIWKAKPNKECFVQVVSRAGKLLFKHPVRAIFSDWLCPVWAGHSCKWGQMHIGYQIPKTTSDSFLILDRDHILNRLALSWLFDPDVVWPCPRTRI